MKNLLMLYLTFFFPAILLANLPQNAPETRVIKTVKKITIENENKLIVNVKEDFLIAKISDQYLGHDSVRETKFVRRKKLDATIFDMTGKKIKELKKNDIKEDTISYYSVHDEHKTIYHKFSHAQVPYLVSTEKEYELKSAFFWPDWDPQFSVPVDYAELHLVFKRPVNFDYVTIGDLPQPEIFTDSDGNKNYRWAVNNIPAYESEYASAPEARHQIGLKFKPAKFDLDGFVGSTNSWQEFGKWFSDLTAGQINLQEDVGLDLTGKPPEEKVKALYEFLQEKTRYVQVYLGVDGWRPHNVNDIKKNMYGDCKDLSVLMIAMLQKEGIEAYPALVMTRDNGWVDPGFPGNNFNHCIAVVPLANDTLWLECTSDFTSPNDPPASIEGTNVLLIKPDRSELVQVPLSPAEANRSVFTASAKINADRSLALEGKVVFTGNFAMGMRGYFKDMEFVKQKEWLMRSLSSNGDAKVTKFELAGLEKNGSDLSVSFAADLTYFARKAGSRLIFRPRLFHKIAFDGEDPEERTMPLLNMTRYTHIDSVEFTLPYNTDLRQSDSGEPLSSKFGEFNANVSQQGNKIFWNSRFVLHARDVSLADYADYHDFMNTAKKSSEMKLVLQGAN